MYTLSWHNFWHFSKHHRHLSPLYITFALWGDQAVAFHVYFMEEARLKDTSEQSMCSLHPICGLDTASTLRTTALLYLLGPEHQCNTESFGRGIKATCRKETSFSIVPSNSERRSWHTRPPGGRGSAVPAPALLWLLRGLREVSPSLASVSTVAWGRLTSSPEPQSEERTRAGEGSTGPSWVNYRHICPSTESGILRSHPLLGSEAGQY